MLHIILAITQMDLKPGFELDQEIDIDIPHILVSSATGFQIDALKEKLPKDLTDAFLLHRGKRGVVFQGRYEHQDVVVKVLAVAPVMILLLLYH